MCSSKLKVFCSSTIFVVTRMSRDMYAYAKCPISCLAHGDRVKSGTGSCLMASFPRNGLHFWVEVVFEMKVFCKTRAFYLILSRIWRTNGDEWRRRERISQPRDRSSYMGHSSSITPRRRSCGRDRQSGLSVPRWGLYDSYFSSRFVYINDETDML